MKPATMPTIFALLCQACGLSQREATEFCVVRPDTVKSWTTGRRGAPPDQLDQLAKLADRIDRAADEAIDEIARQIDAVGATPGVIELGLASDDAEAQSLGWPCVGVHRAVLALTIARGMAEGWRFAVVPRGSTPTTAGAADAIDRL